MSKHTENMSFCGIKIESRTKLYMSHLGVNESEAFLRSVSIDTLPIFYSGFSCEKFYSFVWFVFTCMNITL